MTGRREVTASCPGTGSVSGRPNPSPAALFALTTGSDAAGGSDSGLRITSDGAVSIGDALSEHIYCGIPEAAKSAVTGLQGNARPSLGITGNTNDSVP